MLSVQFMTPYALDHLGNPREVRGYTGAMSAAVSSPMYWSMNTQWTGLALSGKFIPQ